MRLVAAVLWILPAAISAAEPAADALVVESAHDAYPLSRHLLYLEDAEHLLSVDGAAAARAAGRFRAASPTSTDVNFGYSSSAFWLALPLRLEADAPAQWLLEVGYPSLDRVEVYAPRPGGGFDLQVAGDLQPFSMRPFPHRNLVFPLRLAPGVTQTVYFKVESEGNLTIPATLWQPEALHRHDQDTYAALSLYYGILAALLIFSLLLFISTRDPVFIAYSAFIASMAVGQASLNGLGNQYLWPDWPKWGNVALPSGMSATGFFGALFTRLFLGTRQTFPRLDRIILVLAAAFAFSALSPALLSYRFAAIFTSITGLAFSTVAVAGGVYCLSKRHPGARYFLLAWTMLLVGVAVLAMRNMGWLPTTALTLYSMQIGSALEMMLLAFALADRVTAMRREKDTATQEALDAKQRMVDALRRSEEQLELRVAERTRDLGAANARLREKERELEHLACHDHLTGLPNRALLHDRIARATARAQRHGRGAAVLLMDMDNFKAVNDVHGHAAGDLLLVAAAGRLAESVREADTVVRYGGDEFVVVLEDLHELGEATRVADKLVAEMNQPFNLEPGAVRTGVSIGIAYFPEDSADPARLLKGADLAMYAAKSAGGGCWRIAAQGTAVGKYGNG